MRLPGLPVNILAGDNPGVGSLVQGGAPERGVVLHSPLARAVEWLAAGAPASLS